MKKILLIISILFTGLISVNSQTSDPVLMTVGNEKITLSEFKYIFTKNNNNQAITKEALDEYIDLFTKFKLKVTEAKDLKMDTSKAFVNELSGYVEQLAMPFLKDTVAENNYLKVLYDRSTKDVKLRHIMVRLPDCPTAKDTLEAYNKIMKLRKDIIKKKNFESAAVVSDDTLSAKNGGLLGFFSAMTLNHDFETMAYSLKPGEVSMPVRTPYGYHLIKVDEIRPARGTVKIAHIYINADPTNTENFKLATGRINDAYDKLKAGTDWGTVCKEYSDDYKTSATGGELQPFGINQMVQEFEDASFNLKNPGDYSKPFQTQYGWHIVKLISKTGIGTYVEAKSNIQKTLVKSKRYKLVTDQFIDKLKNTYSFKENPAFLKEIQTAAEANNNMLSKASLMKFSGKVVFSYNGIEVKSDDFILSITERLPEDKSMDFCTFKDKQYYDFVSKTLIDYKKSQLPKENYDFKMLVNEYTEGILLFNLMDEKVWTKSVKDTTGLKAYHEQNKNNYMWGNRVDAYIVDCKDDNAEKLALKYAKFVLDGKWSKDKFLEKVNKKVKDNVFIIEGRYSPGDNEIVDGGGFKKGITLTQRKDDKIRFAIVYNERAPEPKMLKEAKGLIISDYQNYLEAEWINNLKTKYPVTINKDVLYSLITK